MPIERLQRILIWLLIAAVSVFLLERLLALLAIFATPLLLFALAWLIALVLQPLIARMTALTLPMPFVSRRSPETQKITPVWNIPRGIAVLLVYIAVLALVVYPAISLTPVIATQLSGLQETLPNASAQVETWVVSAAG